MSYRATSIWWALAWIWLVRLRMAASESDAVACQLGDGVIALGTRA